MAITRSLATNAKSGRVGDTTYYTSQGRQISRAALNSSNYGTSASRTTAQQSRRVRWANLVNFYKLSKGWMPLAFENKKAGVSDYNKLMSINVNGSSIALTKSQAASGACVVEPYQVTEGSMMPISAAKTGNVWVTNIACGLSAIDDATTIAAFSEAVISANSWLSVGCQISFISYQQLVDAQGTPRVICTSYEVTLSTTDTSTLRSYLPSFCTQLSEGYLATGSDISVGAFTYVLSKTESGKTSVSTQVLVNNNAALIAQYSSATAVAEAIASYGVDSDVFLMSGSEQQTATEQPLSVVSADVNGTSLLGSAAYPLVLADTENMTLTLQFTGEVESVATEYIYYNSRDSLNTQILAFENLMEISANKASIRFDNSQPGGETFSVDTQILGALVLVDGVKILVGDSSLTLSRSAWGGTSLGE